MSPAGRQEGGGEGCAVKGGEMAAGEKEQGHGCGGDGGRLGRGRCAE